MCELKLQERFPIVRYTLNLILTQRSYLILVVKFILNIKNLLLCELAILGIPSI